MKAPRSRWSGVIFIAFLRLSDDGQRFRQKRAHQGQQLPPIERCYRHRWILGPEEVGLAMTRLRTRHACLLRDGARRATSFARHRARGGVRVDTPTGDAGSPHHHRRRPILRHPDRHLRQRAVRLTNGQSDFVATTIAPRNNDRFPTTGMKAVTDSRLTKLIAGIMLLLRRYRERSSGGAPLRFPLPASLLSDPAMRFGCRRAAVSLTGCATTLQECPKRPQLSLSPGLQTIYRCAVQAQLQRS